MHSHRQVGTTLIELLVVLLILGLVTSVAGLSMQSVSSQRDTSQAELLRECRRSAVYGGYPHALTRDTVAYLCLPDGQVLGLGANQMIGRLP
jgi:prepilin-type N-terminal cleavage/methylation domain-containing protein